MSRRSPNDRPQAREQLFDMEGLWQVIVRPGVNPVNPLGPASPSRQDQYGRRAIIGAPAFEDRKTIHFRQAEIEDDCPIILGVAAKPGFLTVAYDINHMAARFEGAHDVRGDSAIILDKKHAHYFSLIRSISPVCAST